MNQSAPATTVPSTTDDTPTRVLNAAGPIFAEKGYQATTVREICKAAGVNLASINYHFGDKDRLYIETVRRAHQLRAAQVPLPSLADDVSPAKKLQAFIRTLLTRMLGTDADPWQARLMIREVLHPTEACRAMVEDYFRPHMKILLEILNEVLPAETTPAERQRTAFSIVGQCVFYRVCGEVATILVSEDEYKNNFTIDQLAEHITRFSLAALGLGTPLNRNSPSVLGKTVDRDASNQTNDRPS